MEKLLATRITGGNTAYKRAESDFYPTPEDVTLALLDFMRILRGVKIWEPADGTGDMVQAIKSRGYEVIGTDIQTGTDFLETELPEGVGMIITNPPFFCVRGIYPARPRRWSWKCHSHFSSNHNTHTRGGYLRGNEDQPCNGPQDAHTGASPARSSLTRFAMKMIFARGHNKISTVLSYAGGYLMKAICQTEAAEGSGSQPRA